MVSYNLIETRFLERVLSGKDEGSGVATRLMCEGQSGFLDFSGLHMINRGIIVSSNQLHVMPVFYSLWNTIESSTSHLILDKCYSRYLAFFRGP